MHEIVNVAYCINRKVIEPLCVSMYSAAMNMGRGRIWILHSDLSLEDRKEIRRTIALFPDVDVQFIPINIDVFKDLEGLHGEIIPFSKLLLPSVVDQVERLVYLDADTVVIDNLNDLYTHSLKGSTIGAVSYEPLSRFLERDYFAAEGLDLDAPGFNSGVLLINVDAWNRQDVTSELVERAKNANTRYGVFDQPILNAAFHQDFCPLRIRYNKRASSGNRLEEKHTTDGIVHFVGIPKPWDVGGRWLNRNYKLYDKYRREAGVPCRSFLEILRQDGCKRVAQGLGSGLKSLIR